MFGLEDVSVDTMWLMVILMLLFGVVATAMLLCHHAGMFHSLVVKTCKPAYGEIVLMYKVGRGCYSGCGPLFTETHSLLPQYNCAGIYYDDPSKKPKEGLRYLVGAIISSDGSAINKDDQKTFEEHGYKMLVLPAVDTAVCVEYPYTGVFSTIVAVFRVYPVIREYILQRELCAHPSLEIYDGPAGVILFYSPLEQQGDFYVPEVLSDDVVLTDDPASCESSEEESAADDIEEREREAKEFDARIQKESDAAKSNVTEAVVESEMKRTESWDKSASLISGDDDSESTTVSSFEEVEIPSSHSSPPSPTDVSPAPLAPSSLLGDEEQSKE